MKNIHKNKSRTRLYNAINGVKSITGAAGASTLSTIVFTNNPTIDETLTLTSGGVTTTFTFVAATAAEDQVTIGVGLTNTIDNLITMLLAHSVTGAWGYLHPDDSDALTNTGGTDLDIVFYPGTWANSITLGGDVEITGTPTFTGGVAAPIVSADHKYNTISTVGSASNEEYYLLADGDEVGDRVSVAITAIDSGDTPTILGTFIDSGAKVEAILNAANEYASWLWNGNGWIQVEEGADTTVTYVAA